MDQKIEKLSFEDIQRLDDQRSWVSDHYDTKLRHKLESVEGKLHLLSRIVCSGWVDPTEKWKWQSLGVVFGDALLQRLGVIWVIVEDEYGRDPALQVPGTTILVYPLTMISKRIERGEEVNIEEMFANTIDMIEEMRHGYKPH